MSKRRAEVPMCACEEVHESLVKHSRETMPDEATVYELSDFFKVLGDSTRMRLLMALERSPMCVCDLAVLMNMTKSATSHQLRILRDNNLVRFEKVGKHSYYSLADDHVKYMLNIARDHVNE